MNEKSPIDEYLTALRRALRLRPNLHERILCEVEDHLREAVAGEEEQGTPREEAERRVIERFGPVESVAQWWNEVYTRENGGPKMWQRFTERARRIVFFAQEEAARLGENSVGTEHLLLGLVREDDSVAARILVKRLDIPLESIRAATEQQVTRGQGNLGQDMELTPCATKMIDLAHDESRRLNNNYIGSEHLLLGLILEEEGLGGRVLRELGASLERTRAAVDALLKESDAQRAAEERALAQRVKREFLQVVERVAPFTPEVRALIQVLTTHTPEQAADAVASFLKLTDADRQAVSPPRPTQERLAKLSELLTKETVSLQVESEGEKEGPGGNTPGTA